MARPQITDDFVQRLLAGEGTEDISIGDVSDIQLYGRLHRRRLSGADEQAALELGCDPVVYQSISWWTLAWIPVVPMKSYIVLPYLKAKEGAEYNSYRSLPTSMQLTQMALHYIVGWLVVLIVLTVMWWGVHRH